MDFRFFCSQARPVLQLILWGSVFSVFLAVLWTFLPCVRRRRLAVLPRPPYLLSFTPFFIGPGLGPSTSGNSWTLVDPFSRRLLLFRLKEGSLKTVRKVSYSRRHSEAWRKRKGFLSLFLSFFFHQCISRLRFDSSSASQCNSLSVDGTRQAGLEGVKKGENGKTPDCAFFLGSCTCKSVIFLQGGPRPPATQRQGTKGPRSPAANTQ